MPFKEALNIASLNLHVRALLPKWLIALRSTWRHANVAFDELYVRSIAFTVAQSLTFLVAVYEGDDSGPQEFAREGRAC